MTSRRSRFKVVANIPVRRKANVNVSEKEEDKNVLGEVALKTEETIEIGKVPTESPDNLPKNNQQELLPENLSDSDSANKIKANVEKVSFKRIKPRVCLPLKKQRPRQITETNDALHAGATSDNDLPSSLPENSDSGLGSSEPPSDLVFSQETKTPVKTEQSAAPIIRPTTPTPSASLLPPSPLKSPSRPRFARPALFDSTLKRQSFHVSSASESEDDVKRQNALCENACARSRLEAANTPITDKGPPVDLEDTVEISRFTGTSSKRKKPKPSYFVRRLAEARRDFHRKFENKKPDRSSLKMFDLIFYNPPSNPSKCEDDTNNSQSNASGLISEREKQLLEEEIDNPDLEAVEGEEKENEDDVEAQAPVPQVKIGENGEIILDEKSLVIETTEGKKGREALMKSAPVLEDKNKKVSYYGKKKIKATDWSPWETKCFYKALNSLGTDFALMQNLFPNRSRGELKNKFKREERCYPGLIESALGNPSQFNIKALQLEFDRDREKLEEELRQKEVLKQQLEKEKKEQRALRKEARAALLATATCPVGVKRIRPVRTKSRKRTLGDDFVDPSDVIDDTENREPSIVASPSNGQSNAPGVSPRKKEERSSDLGELSPNRRVERLNLTFTQGHVSGIDYIPTTTISTVVAPTYFMAKGELSNQKQLSERLPAYGTWQSSHVKQPSPVPPQAIESKIINNNSGMQPVTDVEFLKLISHNIEHLEQSTIQLVSSEKGVNMVLKDAPNEADSKRPINPIVANALKRGSSAKTARLAKVKKLVKVEKNCDDVGNANQNFFLSRPIKVEAGEPYIPQNLETLYTFQPKIENESYQTPGGETPIQNTDSTQVSWVSDQPLMLTSNEEETHTLTPLETVRFASNLDEQVASNVNTVSYETVGSEEMADSYENTVAFQNVGNNCVESSITLTSQSFHRYENEYDKNVMSDNFPSTSRSFDRYENECDNNVMPENSQPMPNNGAADISNISHTVLGGNSDFPHYRNHSNPFLTDHSYVNIMRPVPERSVGGINNLLPPNTLPTTLAPTLVPSISSAFREVVRPVVPSTAPLSVQSAPFAQPVLQVSNSNTTRSIRTAVVNTKSNDNNIQLKRVISNQSLMKRKNSFFLVTKKQSTPSGSGNITSSKSIEKDHPSSSLASPSSITSIHREDVLQIKESSEVSQQLEPVQYKAAGGFQYAVLDAGANPNQKRTFLAGLRPGSFVFMETESPDLPMEKRCSMYMITEMDSPDGTKGFVPMPVVLPPELMTLITTQLNS